MTVKRNQFGWLSTGVLTTLTSLNRVEFVVSFGCKSSKNTPLNLHKSFICKDLERVKGIEPSIQTLKILNILKIKGL
jgi:hypothetical protein